MSANPVAITLPPALAGIRDYCGACASPMVRAGNLLYLSGIVAIDPLTGAAELGTVESETWRCMKNLDLMLQVAGTRLAKVMQVHVLIFDRKDYASLNAAYREFFPHEAPARTVWSVQLERGFKVKFDVIALLDEVADA